MELRSDQTKTIEELDRLLAAGKRRIVIQAPCGFGKTVLAGSLVTRELEQKRRTLFVVPAIGLIDQTVEVFRRFGLQDDIGVIQAYHELTDWRCPVQVCSVQTLQRRPMPDAEFVILDEIHQFHQFYGTWMLNPKWADIPFIGLSATPWRKGLGAYFSDLIVAATTAEMIEAGHLSDFEVFAPSSPDLKGVRTVAGDYHEGQLGDRMNTAALVADVVTTWLERAKGLPTLCFAVNRLHAQHLQQQFEAAGVPCGYQDCFTKDDERREIRRKFQNGEYQVVSNCDTLTTGVDLDVRCIVLARPTKSEILFVQIVGRGLRTAEGKEKLLILDHSDNHLRLGFVTDIQHDSLDNGKEPLAAQADPILLPKKCPKCSYLKPPKTAVCPACGFKAEAIDKTKVADGVLAKLDRRKHCKKHVPLDHVSEEDFFRQLMHVEQSSGYRRGWCEHKFAERFGDKKPLVDWELKGPSMTSPAVASWVHSQRIKWAKSRYNPQHRHASNNS